MPDPTCRTNRQQRRPSFNVPPLRLPGQSLDEDIQALREKTGELLIPSLIFVILSMAAWIQWWTGRPLPPVGFSILAFLTIVYAGGRIRSVRNTINRLRLGRDGERLVGQVLEQLREQGYRVFHDIPGPSFNIDHALVGPAGVFTVETKSRTKPLRGSSKLFYDGKSVRIAGKNATTRPLNQARAQAQWLTTLLNGTERARIKVRPIVVFPEWYVERIGTRHTDDVWVLNPKALATFLECEPTVLSRASVHSTAQILAQHCRNPARESC